MRQAAVARGADCQRVTACQSDEARQVLRRVVGTDDQDLRHGGGLGHRRHIGHRVEAQSREQCLINRQAVRPSAQHQTVGTGANDDLIADVAAGARMVLDYNWLAQLCGHVAGQQAGDDVLASARRHRYDETQRPVREWLSTGKRRDKGGGGQQGAEDGATVHTSVDKPNTHLVNVN